MGFPLPQNVLAFEDQVQTLCNGLRAGDREPQRHNAQLRMASDAAARVTGKVGSIPPAEAALLSVLRSEAFTAVVRDAVKGAVGQVHEHEKVKRMTFFF